MALTDPIADTLARIRNAQMRQHKYVDCLRSRLIVCILQVFQDEGYIESFEEVTVPGKSFSMVRVHLRYYMGRSSIRKMWRVSKPGCRVYRSVARLGKVANGLGVYVLSTSKGVMSCRRARELHLGGEVLCGLI